MTSRFARDTAIEELGGGRFGARMDRGWWIVRGPNGGYVAAVVLRAMIAAVGDDTRHPRSLTVHYTAPPAEGPVHVETSIEKQGRSITTVTARMFQGERLCAMAIGAFSGEWPGPELHDRSRPVAPPPEQCTVSSPTRPADAAPSDFTPPPLMERYDMRWAIGHPPRTEGDQALAGGWIRFSDPEVVDAVGIAAIADAWVPPIFGRISQPMVVPTVDLTIHFRARLPLDGAAADDWLLCVFNTTVVQEGFLEEDGEIWSPDGRLLAHSRQLAVAMPFTA